MTREEMIEQLNASIAKYEKELAALKAAKEMLITMPEPLGLVAALAQARGWIGE